MIIIPTAYLGNIQYYTKLLSGRAVIDLGENYPKQSYRNRMDMLCANGVMSLTVPVLKPHNEKVSTKEVRIDNSKKWRHTHLHAIISAYSRSPYFEHYAAEVEAMFAPRYELLAEMNAELQARIFKLLKVSPEVGYSEEYIEAGESDTDLRSAMSHKPRLHRPDPLFTPEPYEQTFSDRTAFVPNLSIIDLLMSEGPYAVEVIKGSRISPE